MIGHSLDAKLTVYAAGDVYHRLVALSDELATILIVSQTDVIKGLESAPTDAFRSDEMSLAAAVTTAGGDKCERCWMYSPTVGADAEHHTLCRRCSTALR